MTCRKIEVTKRNHINLIYINSVFTSGKDIGKILSERAKRGMLQDMILVHKKEKRVNGVDQWCIFIFLGGFKVMEVHAVEQWVKVITEVPEI